MEQQTNAMLNTKLPSVFEDLNVPVWLLIGSGFTTIASRRQQSEKKILVQALQGATQICDTTSLNQKTTLRTSSAPSAVTEVTLLLMYVFWLQTLVNLI
jgi:hypothetical protein